MYRYGVQLQFGPQAREPGGSVARILLLATVLLSCVGCATSQGIAGANGAPTCRSLATFEELLISPFTSDGAWVEEQEYKDLPRFIAAETSEVLQARIEDKRVFGKVLHASDCSSHAIKLDGKIYRVI